ncbi:Rieske (2Fe-2S) protein [Streptomyces sp. NBC_01433]|uniref:Rieske (2Fe-2S) protein n=1 Tax=Streptomyces sp. NBC_01433 TaxID=2903864 RepID=UPI002251BE7D|nr:Rieske (2Fe-2S) protein [Streptomyces sp. NBC_01433]MCX4678703.1 Rieske (2Fe-2S) protein [Streptomyces sp. NBC_01433]
MSASQERRVLPGRRTVVAAVGAAGVAAALTACGGSDGSEGSDTVEQAGSGKSREVLANTADIPEGGGTVFAKQGVVVTQPKAGEFKAFSATCTHQGCAVKDVSNGSINCPCHDSAFDSATGAVTAGPATRPLPTRRITVADGAITLA